MNEFDVSFNETFTNQNDKKKNIFNSYFTSHS